MTVNLYSTDIVDFVIRKEYPENRSVSEVAEYSYHMNHQIGKLYYKESYFDGVRISYAEIDLNQPAKIHFESDFETVEMHFALNGRSVTCSKDIQGDVNFSSCQQNIIYSSNAKGTLQFCDKHIRVFEVNLSTSFFLKYLPEDAINTEVFRRKIEDGYCSAINSSNRLISPAMFQIINEIIGCNRAGVFKKMFLEARVIELLMLQMEELNLDKTTSTVIKKADEDKVYMAREYIVNNLQQPLSLAELARYSGTNEFTLKRSFKEVFGTTVFGFMTDLKMQEAQKMLRNPEININEISDLSGYKNPQHFSAAFRKRFGKAPSELRKEILRA